MPAGNLYTAETPIKIGDKECNLLYTWRQHGEIRTVFSKKTVQQIITDCYPEEIAALLAIGLKTNNPEITTDCLLDMNPPIALAIALDTIAEALTRSIKGPSNIVDKVDDSQNSPPSDPASEIQ